MSYESLKRQAFLDNASRSFNFVLVKLVCDFSFRISDELKLVLLGLHDLDLSLPVFQFLLLNGLHIGLDLNFLLRESLNTFHLGLINFTLQNKAEKSLPRPALVVPSELGSFPGV